MKAVVRPKAQHLEHLYEISKLFANGDGASQPFDAAVGVVARAVPLRCAILTDRDGTRARRTVWSTGTAGRLRAAHTHMTKACRYLLERPIERVTEELGTTPLPPQPRDRRRERKFIVLPLVLAWRAPFGALLIEGAHPFTEADLRFISAVAHQLSIALDRERNRRLDIDRREEAEKGRLIAERHRLLAEQAMTRAEALVVENARLYEEARQAVRVREQVLAVVSHDLRSPLSTVVMAASTLVERAPSNERRREVPTAVGRIRRASDRMLRLIDDLLDFGSIEAGQLKIVLRSEDARTLVLEAIAAHEELAQLARVALHSDVTHPLPILACDRDRILQVLGNLVGNAIKATPENGKITLRATARAKDVLFSIADDGPGIAAADLAHLFERYWRADKVAYRGTGLGLAVSKGLVEAHGGQIWAESKVGRGATFHFTLPTSVSAAVPMVHPIDRRKTPRA